MTESYYHRFREWQEAAIGKRIFDHEKKVVDQLIKTHKPKMIVQLEGRALLDSFLETVSYYHVSEDADIMARGYSIEAEQGFMPFPDRSVDLVLVGHALELYHNRRATLAEIERVLAPGGRVLLMVLLKRWFEDGVPKQYNPLTDLHVTPLSLKKIEKWLAAEELSIEKQHALVEDQSYMMTERLTDIMIHPVGLELVRVELADIWDGVVGAVE